MEDISQRAKPTVRETATKEKSTQRDRDSVEIYIFESISRVGIRLMSH